MSSDALVNLGIPALTSAGLLMEGVSESGGYVRLAS
jgi:hypothetical protein